MSADQAETLEQMVRELRASHPVFRDLTIRNAILFIPLIIPHVVLSELKRKSSIIHDPFVSKLATAPGAQLVKLRAHEHIDSVQLLTLTYYLTEQMVLTRHPRIRQIVAFGTPMNSYSYWCQDLADCKVFQLYPNGAVVDEINRVLKQANATLLARDYQAINANVLDERWQDILLAAGFDPSIPTLWMFTNWMSCQSEQVTERMLALVDELSSPYSQIYADMCSGHRFTLKLADDAPEVVLQAGAGAMYGEDASVFRPIKEWGVELLLRRNEDREYNGSMWSDKLNHLRVTDEKNATLGPFYMARFRKPV